MKKTLFILFVLYGLIPVKAISVGNFDPFTAVVLLLLAASMWVGLRWALTPGHPYRLPSRYMFLIFFVLFLSFVHMILDLGILTSWIPIWVMNYALFWVLLREIKTRDEIQLLFSRLVVLNIAAILLMMVFFMNPGLLEGPLREAGMGSFRGYMSEVPRVFTPGMPYVALGVVFGLSYLVYARQPRKKWQVLLFVTISFLALTLFTSVRAYLIAIVLGGIILMLVRFNWKNVSRGILWGSLALFLVYLVVPQKYSEYVRERLVVPVRSADQLDLSDEPETGFGQYQTLYWRVLDAQEAMDLMESPGQILFGRMGNKYDLPGLDQAQAPHISVVGIYYLFGLVGVILFLIFGAFFTVQIIKVNIQWRDTDLEYITAFLLAAWVMLMAISLVGGGVYYAPECAAVGAICALTMVLRHRIPRTQENVP